ncbi:ADP-ribosylation factor GTPase-activating protein 3-like [Ciona intestinalis]
MSENLSTIHAVPASSVRLTTTKSTITKKNAKKGLGAKKSGLGAHKVTKADFEKLEKTAEILDSSKSKVENNETMNEPVSKESLRLAYRDIETTEKQNDVRMSRMDGKRKEQAERLGMGMGRTGGVSHSLNMMTIDQTNPTTKPARRGRYEDNNDTFYDAFFSPPKNSWESDSDDEVSRKKFSGSSVDRMSTFSTGNTGSKSESRNNNRPTKPTITYDSQPVPNNMRNNKSISSEMLFGTQSEASEGQRLRKFKNSTAISSDEFYDRPPQSNHVPDVSDIKDGVKEGVKSVAGKLSSIASGIASTIQDRYG